MKKIYTFLLIALIGLYGCTPPGSNTRPQMTADKLIIKVGETATITMTAPRRAITTSPDQPIPVNDTGFLFTPDPNQPTQNPNQSTNQSSAPYLLNIDGVLAGPQPSAFPIAPQLEMVIPITGTDNVPPRVTTTNEGDQSKATFIVKGKSAGTVILRGGFLSNAVEVPNTFKRTPFVPIFDGIITIQVVP